MLQADRRVVADQETNGKVCSWPAAEVAFRTVNVRNREADGRLSRACDREGEGCSRPTTRGCVVICFRPVRLHFLQFFDVPAAISPTMDAILANARAERLLPGECGVDRLGALRDTRSSVDVPTVALATTVDAAERVRRALAATRRVPAQRDDRPTAAPGPAAARKR